MKHFWWVLVLIYFSAASCADNVGADLSQISTEDAGLYCQAKEAWGDVCDAGGENPVLYDEDIPSLGHAYWGTKFGKSWWVILLQPDNPCMYEVIRHEIGHITGYKHNENSWMDETDTC